MAKTAIIDLKRPPLLVMNVRVDPDTMQLTEVPIMCIKSEGDYYALMTGDLLGHDICPSGSYSYIVTIH